MRRLSKLRHDLSVILVTTATWLPGCPSKGRSADRIETVRRRIQPSFNDPYALEKRIMRIYEGDYAYEVEPVLDPATLIRAGWKYNVYRIRPVNQLLHSGTAGSREEAELKGRRAVQHAIRQQKHESAA